MPHPSYLFIHTCTICMLYVCLRAIDHEHDSTFGMYIHSSCRFHTSCVCCCMQIDRLSVLENVLAQEKLASQHIVSVYETGV